MEHTDGNQDLELSQRQIDRRTAMRVALGGAAAGAVFVAPKVKGFSIAPDYAAAATACTDGPVGTTATVKGNRKSRSRGICTNTHSAICYGGTPSAGNQGACGSNWSCTNTGNYTNTNEWSNGVNLSLFGSELTYAVAGASELSGPQIGQSYKNNSRAHMQINTIGSKFNRCEATMALSCERSNARGFLDMGTNNSDNSAQSAENNWPISWTRSRNVNEPAAGWSNRWKLDCKGYEGGLGNNGSATGSTVTITFKCFCA